MKSLIGRVSLLLSILGFVVFSWQSGFAQDFPEPDWKYVEQQLRAHKFQKSFISKMRESYNKDGFIDVLRLNVLLFLRKADYHGPQINDQAVGDVRDYIKKYQKTLALAEKRYKVPGEVVVSLIWLESRLGENKGSFHVPSVYLHLLQAKRKPIIDFLKTQTARFTEAITPKQIREIPLRAKRKSQWAIEELRAIQRIHTWKWRLEEDFTGSFAGAFGMPQFIPSSYTKWARAVKTNTQPDLSDPQDAMMSVAFYLKDHGWSRSKKSQIEALMKYNNSKDYALAILELAARTKSQNLKSNQSNK